MAEELLRSCRGKLRRPFAKRRRLVIDIDVNAFAHTEHAWEPPEARRRSASTRIYHSAAENACILRAENQVDNGYVSEPAT